MKSIKKRRQKNRPSGRTVNKRIIAAALLIVALLIEVCVLAYNGSTQLLSSVSDVWKGMLEAQGAQIKDVLFMKNPYLTPDKHYLNKLESVFYGDPEMVLETAEDGRCDPGQITLAISNLTTNIKKGMTYTSGLRSCYWMLADPAAPYVLMNGTPTLKKELTDTAWLDSCLSMEDDVAMEWRSVSLSYLNNKQVLTVYRRVRSERFMTPETIEGYWVLNYDLSTMLNAMMAKMPSLETVYLYDMQKERTVSAGTLDLSGEMESRLLSEAVQALNSAENMGILHDEDKNAFYYRIEEVCPGMASIVCMQDTQIMRALSSVKMSMLTVLVISCVAVAGINIHSMIRYSKYNNGLRKMFAALRSQDGERKPTEDPHEQAGSELLIQRILNNDVDLDELQGLVESKQELKAELDALYGHVQINSHFLLNTLDSIYWMSVSNMGAFSRESAMIGNLCEILKFALDSSDLYTSLREEMECTSKYVEIQQMRKSITTLSVEWDIPPELAGARVGKLILQPVVENCIQHAFQKCKTGDQTCHIRITAQKNGEEYLRINVEDDGQGMSDKQLRRMNADMKKQRYLHSRHIGLANVNRRLQVQFGGESGVSLYESPLGGLGVCLLMKYSVY